MKKKIQSKNMISEGEYLNPRNPFIVMKFGGTSISSANNWKTIISIIKKKIDNGFKPIIIVSALAGISDLLNSLTKETSSSKLDVYINDFIQVHEKLAKTLNVSLSSIKIELNYLEQLVEGIKLTGEINDKVIARIMASGEICSSLLAEAYIKKQKIITNLLDAKELLKSNLDSDSRSYYFNATCNFDVDKLLIKRFNDIDGVILTQGFIAEGKDSDTVLLGRGGSDTSASYIASIIQAKHLEIWTDVPGIFSANPHIISSARLIKSLTYEEAQEISSAGGSVLHPRSIRPAKLSNIPIYIKSTKDPDLRGTLISTQMNEMGAQLKAVSQKNDVVLISMESIDMWHKVGYVADIFNVFRKNNISIDLISTSESNITVTIDNYSDSIDRELINKLVEKLTSLCKVSVRYDCSAITLVGRKIRTILNEFSPIFDVFRENKIHMVTQASNDLNFTFVIDSELSYKIIHKIHRVLTKNFSEDSIFGKTWEQLTTTIKKESNKNSIKPWFIEKKEKILEIAKKEENIYLYDSESIIKALLELKSLSSVSRIFYAMKANSNIEILKIIESYGLNFECVSIGEIKRVLNLFPSIDRKRLLYTPNFASKDEIKWALEQNIFFTLDNLYPLEKWPELFANKEIFIRLDTGSGSGHHEHVKTAGILSKFGIPLSEIGDLKRISENIKLKIIGFHAHTGSGIFDADNWKSIGEILMSLTHTFPTVKYLDLGGGIGIPEKIGDEPIDLIKLETSIGSLNANDKDLEIWLEPGRYIVGQAGALISRVTQTKGKGKMKYLGISTGMNSLIRPALYGAYHEIFNLSSNDNSKEHEIVTVVGPICETGDRLGSDRLLPPSNEGDVILISNVGAYGYSMSSNYNLRDPAIEIII
ncbi:MAG: diaminopimelate decarboxylase [Gammaproteobacteria bacterium TMED78]|nr:MAG: diaminopimelate decarboxylase [Gammaproteobacteria bacterium TMED78]|tara:strand:+ start:13612 stop:16242 length:2631 start_codon:yes stop_codon:yes gene_type:complete